MSDLATRDALLEQALDMPPTLRAEFLRLACGADLDLRRELERLLEVHRQARSDVVDRRMVDEPACEAGSTIDQFVIRALIGMGRMGVVYRAHHTKSGRDVALKLLSRFGASMARRRPRPIGEAVAERLVEHEGIARVFLLSENQGRLFLVMELLEGQDLAKIIAGRHSIEIAQRLDWLTQLATALHAAHVRGGLHRDLKPSNIFLTADGRIKLLEFEITRHGGPAAGLARVVAGTPTYMAPEYWSHEPLTQATDVYAFGVVLAELFAPAGSRATESAADDARERPTVEDIARVAPLAIVDLFKRATAPHPRDRIQTFDEVVRILNDVRSPWSGKSWRPGSI